MFRNIVATPCLCLCLAAGPAPAARLWIQDLLVNGGFETGDFTGWSVATQPGSDLPGPEVSPLPVAPATGLPVAPPTEGAFQALTGQFFAGGYALLQTFDYPAVPADGSRLLSWELSFDLFVSAGSPLVPGGLDPLGPPTQEVRVDALDLFADPFDDGPGLGYDLVQAPMAGGFPASHVSYSFDMIEVVGQGAWFPRPWQLRFVTVGNLGPMSIGVDNVSMQAVVQLVPVPSVGLLLAGGLAGLALARCRSGRAKVNPPACRLYSAG